MEAIELLGGMVNSVLEFPLVGFLGRLVPVGGSEAGQQVATAVGVGLDNLGSLCSQAGLDRWELLGLAVLSAITVYRKELSSNSVYGKGGAGGAGGPGGRRYHHTGDGGSAVVVHVDGCHVAMAAAGGDKAQPPAAAAAAADTGKPCMCARIAAQQRQRASAARRLRQAEDERRLESLVAGGGRMMMIRGPLDHLSVNNHLQQLRASVDASWSSFSTAWEARRARGSGSGSTEGGGPSEAKKPTAASPPLPPPAAAGFVMPPCTHRAAGPPPGSGRGRGHTASEGGRTAEEEEEECPECAVIAAAHALAGAATTTGGRLVRQQQQQQQQGRGTEVIVDVWAGSSLGVLNADALHRALTFLQPRDLLELAQASRGSREAADSQLVWREVWWARFGAIWESEICKKAARRWHLHDWNPKSSAVTQGWREFFFEFEATWLEWLAAGQNLESSCLVGVHGRLYDITDFMHRHPGSPETLMENAGADASEFFEDVGHSLDARGLMKSLDSLAPGCAAAAAGAGGGGSKWRGSSASGARGGGSGSGGGVCMLSSTAQRIRKGRALARREAKAVHAEAHATAAGGGAAVPGGRWGVQEFVCEHCELAFEPTDLDADGSAGKERRLQCPGHPNGELRVFYSPVRGEWGGFYSCCRKHVCFCIPPEALV